jgi:hypothetical protein
MGAVAMQRILHLREGRLGSHLTLAILLDQGGQLLQRSRWVLLGVVQHRQRQLLLRVGPRRRRSR